MVIEKRIGEITLENPLASRKPRNLRQLNQPPFTAKPFKSKRLGKILRALCLAYDWVGVSDWRLARP